jgi:hypothetical protein
MIKFKVLDISEDQRPNDYWKEYLERHADFSYNRQSKEMTFNVKTDSSGLLRIIDWMLAFDIIDKKVVIDLENRFRRSFDGDELTYNPSRNRFY